MPPRFIASLITYFTHSAENVLKCQYDSHWSQQVVEASPFTIFHNDLILLDNGSFIVKYANDDQVWLCVPKSSVLALLSQLLMWLPSFNGQTLSALEKGIWNIWMPTAFSFKQANSRNRAATYRWMDVHKCCRGGFGTPVLLSLVFCIWWREPWASPWRIIHSPKVGEGAGLPPIIAENFSWNFFAENR